MHWTELGMDPVEWLACELLTTYTSDLNARELQTLLYEHASQTNHELAWRWYEGERRTIYDNLPHDILMHLQLEPM